MDANLLARETVLLQEEAMERLTAMATVVAAGHCVTPASEQGNKACEER